jgi:hypothetical protein
VIVSYKNPDSGHEDNQSKENIAGNGNLDFGSDYKVLLLKYLFLFCIKDPGKFIC